MAILKDTTVNGNISISKDTTINGNISISGNITGPIATSSKFGLVKSTSTGTTENRYYNVEVNSSTRNYES